VGRAGREFEAPSATQGTDDAVFGVVELQSVFGVGELYPVPVRRSEAGRSGVGREVGEGGFESSTCPRSECWARGECDWRQSANSGHPHCWRAHVKAAASNQALGRKRETAFATVSRSGN
jgi:hypothetical protein